MKKIHSFLLVFLVSLIILFIYPVTGNAQIAMQTIRGTVIDADSKGTLPGAMVFIVDSEPPIGAVADINGNFRMENVPVGRYNLKMSFIGYDPVIIPEVMVVSGKETVMTVELKESATQLDAVEVKAYAKKDQSTNSLAMISARQLTMEEASRYAGGIDDPARLASSFAGVAGTLSSNAIVVRGNAPKGLLWRMEGIEIPNPSHFANVTSFGGGGITALSSQMLANSDFYSGAFPAEYGNALSGVFDMKIRNGNNEQHEHSLRAGLTGLDLSGEGPFRKERRSSYLFNYRYSTLALLSGFLPENAQGIGYQDLSWKINLPTEKTGNISFWGLLSSDFTGSKPNSDTSSRVYYSDYEKDRNNNRMGAIGLNHKIIFDGNTYIQSSIAATGNFISWKRQRLNHSGVFTPREDIRQSDSKISADVLINHKFSAQHTNRTGFGYHLLSYKVLLKSAGETGSMITYADEHGRSSRMQAYTQSRVELTPSLILNVGFHVQWFGLNRELNLEPRIGLKWNSDDRQSWSFAYGRHSRLEPLCYYLAQQTVADETIYPNRKLGFTRSTHLIAAYEHSLATNTRLRIEAFYQRLSDVPVVAGSSFSMSNLEMDWFFNDSLVNRGKGVNLGVDITLERFLGKGYYYLLTASLFDSKYLGGDNTWRDSRFNRGFVGNMLVGKEWNLGESLNQILGINGRITYLGGERITPLDIAASQSVRDVVYDESSAYEDQLPATWYVDLSASWQKNHKRYTSTWSLHFINLLFQKEFYGYRYNLQNGSIEPFQESVVIPNLSYRIDF